MEAWRIVFRKFSQIANADGLKSLLEALETDSPTLIQGVTTSPPALACYVDQEVEACCLIGFTGWREGCVTVNEVEEYFASMCYQIDDAIGEPGGCRFLLNWYDETPREEVRAKLIPELRFALGLTSDPVAA